MRLKSVIVPSVFCWPFHKIFRFLFDCLDIFREKRVREKGLVLSIDMKRGQFLVLICKAERGQGAIFDFRCTSSLWPELG